MFNHQLINAVVQWEWQAKMAEEKQKNLRGEPLATAVTAPPAPQKERRTFTWPRRARQQTNQGVYVGCAEQCS